MNQEKPASIFINYRREKTRDKAKILRAILESHFGTGSVFLDEISVTLGTKWEKYIQEAVENAEVLISLIHKDWHKDDDEAGLRRLHFEGDWVRKEIETAKERKA